MSAKDFLVEIGTEELPPKSLRLLAESFAQGLTRGLADAALVHRDVEYFASPRRLAVRVRKLASHQPDRTVERRGPPVKAAFDSEGAPTRAGLAFAAGCGVEVSELERLETPKGAWLLFRGTETGAGTIKLLPSIIRTALERLPIAKRMRWGSGEAEFVRPVHWVVMLYGKEVVPASVLGRDASNLTHGHRFMAPRAYKVTTPAAYENTLRRRGRVLVDLEERRGAILDGVTRAGEKLGGTAIVSDGLLDEVTALVEWPVPLTGRFENEFLALPDEVLIATLQDHQRYFPVRDSKGALLPWFVTVANIESPDPAKVIAGNERVVRPRLSDAAFFWSTDRKQSLASRYEALRRVTFQTELGSLHDKAERVRALAVEIARLTGGDEALAGRAAELAKCDLLTSMVGEFPELQGVMGRYYALHDGEPSEVADALREQYLPRFAGDELPVTRTGMTLAIADRLDTIVGIFAAGQKPSGTKDPFGLRRAALGLLRIMIEQQLDMDLIRLIDRALSALPITATPGLSAEVYDYVIERLRAYYLDGEAGFDVLPEMFDAVLGTRPSSPLDFHLRLQALERFLRLPDAQSLASANKRISNLLRKSEESIPAMVDPDLLRDPAEQILAEQVEAMAKQTRPMFDSREYTQALSLLAALRGAVDDFFDSVMVMAEDPALRLNRLALLQQIQSLFIKAADLSRLPG
jgi:glycyl-tRNA synthetase beta chain